jgi:hypothetical protein
MCEENVADFLEPQFYVPNVTASINIINIFTAHFPRETSKCG